MTRLTSIAAACLVAFAGAPAAAETICPSIHQPVCASKGATTRTFSNQCLAEGAGYAVVSPGACGEAPGRRISFCTKEYAPVCARRGGRAKTFGNACEAKAAGYAVMSRGEC